jgi:NAD(P)-dependent dehydrogenase (short-subunit alcohol dehydrogenase family)
MATSVTIDMSGKVALVTGGGYGMGRASARRFASCGARVVVADIDVSRGLETVEMISKDGGSGLFIEADVSQSAAVQDMVARTLASYGRLDYAHNNAGPAAEPSSTSPRRPRTRATRATPPIRRASTGSGD